MGRFFFLPCSVNCILYSVNQSWSYTTSLRFIFNKRMYLGLPRFYILFNNKTEIEKSIFIVFFLLMFVLCFAFVLWNPREVLDVVFSPHSTSSTIFTSLKSCTHQCTHSCQIHKFCLEYWYLVGADKCTKYFYKFKVMVQICMRYKLSTMFK